MDESNIEEFISREMKLLKKDKKPDYLEAEPFRTHRMLEENVQLIKEKGFKPGVEIWLTLVKMKGVIIEIRENEMNSIVVKREDGETFAYSPREIEKIKP